MELNSNNIDSIINNLAGFIEANKVLIKSETIHSFYTAIENLKKLYQNDVISIRDNSINSLKEQKEIIHKLDKKIESLNEKIDILFSNLGYNKETETDNI